MNLGLFLWCSFLSQVVAGGSWAGTHVGATWVRAVRQMGFSWGFKRSFDKICPGNLLPALPGRDWVGSLAQWSFKFPQWNLPLISLPASCTWKRAAKQQRFARGTVWVGRNLDLAPGAPGCLMTPTVGVFCVIRNGRKASPLSVVSYRERGLLHSPRETSECRPGPFRGSK